MTRRVLAAWILATASLLLALASSTGRGTGIAGWTGLSGAGLSYVFLVVGLATALWIGLAGRTEPEVPTGRGGDAGSLQESDEA